MNGTATGSSRAIAWTEWLAVVALVGGAALSAYESQSGPRLRGVTISLVALLVSAFCLLGAAGILRRSPLAAVTPGCAVAMAAMVQWAGRASLESITALGACAAASVLLSVDVMRRTVRRHPGRSPAEWVFWATLPVLSTCSLAAWARLEPLYEGTGPVLGAMFCAAMARPRWQRTTALAVVVSLTAWVADLTSGSSFGGDAVWHPTLAAVGVGAVIVCDLRWRSPANRGGPLATTASVSLLLVTLGVSVVSVHRLAYFDGFERGKTDGRQRAEGIAAAKEQRRKEAAELQVSQIDPDRERPEGKAKQTEDGCRESDGCAERGACSVHWAGFCQPGSDQDCGSSRACRDDGSCKRLSYGSEDVGYCGPGRDEDCEGSPACRTTGDCVVYDVQGLKRCGPRDRDTCAGTLGCRSWGHCMLAVTAEGLRYCGPASEADCRSSPACRVLGLCSVGVGSGVMRCMAKSEQDCHDSVICRDLSFCTLMDRGRMTVCGAPGM